jgi:TraM recognition site of TraD and TraG
VPVGEWLADSASRGVQIIVVCHGMSQLTERWDEAGANKIRDTTGVKIVLPGITDDEFLKVMADTAGKATYRMFDGTLEQGDVMDPWMIRRLPEEWGLIIRRNRPPVLAHLPQVWGLADYRTADRAGIAVAQLAPARTVELVGPDRAALAAFHAAISAANEPVEPTATIPAQQQAQTWDTENVPATTDAYRPWQRKVTK